MEHDNQESLEQMLLNFEALVDVAKRVCERYGIGDRGTPGSARSGDQSRTASALVRGTCVQFQSRLFSRLSSKPPCNQLLNR
jgi:hypothetical protein